MSPVESAFGRTLELSAKDGSIVPSAGLMILMAEVLMVLMSLRGALAATKQSPNNGRLLRDAALAMT